MCKVLSGAVAWALKDAYSNQGLGFRVLRISMIRVVVFAIVYVYMDIVDESFAML